MTDYFPEYSGKDVSVSVRPYGTPATTEAPKVDYFPEFTKQSEGKNIGSGEALALGVQHGLTFGLAPALAGLQEAAGPEVGAAADVLPPPIAMGAKNLAGAARLLHEYFTNSGGPVSQRYEHGRKEAVTAQEEAYKQHPYLYSGGDIAATLGMPIGGAAGGGLRSAVLGGMKVGALAGGAQGAGEAISEGEAPLGVATRAGTGTGLGLVAGGALPLATAGVAAGARAATERGRRLIGAIRNPKDEAARRIVTQTNKGIEIDPNATRRLTDQELIDNPHATLLDLGGEPLNSLAGATARASPEARHILGDVIENRFKGQTKRVTDFLRQEFNYPDRNATAQALRETTKQVDAARYGKAIADGRRGIWNDELAQISRAPAMQEAVRAATKSAQNKGVTNIPGGQQAVGERWISPDGKPTLEFWNLVKIKLDDQIADAVSRPGKASNVADLTAIKNALLEHLDAAVPSYASAREGHELLKGSSNALEAGAKFVTKNFDNEKIRAALAHMKPTDRRLFQDGFVSKYIDDLEHTGDTRNVLNKINDNPAAREKLNMVLGKEKADALEAKLRVEGIVDLSRKVLAGSQTMRYILEGGLAVGSDVASGFNPANPDPISFIKFALTYGLAKGSKAGLAHINQRVLTETAKALVSRDPAVLQRGLQLVSKNKNFLESIRRFDQAFARASARGGGGAGAAQFAAGENGNAQAGQPQ
jgi:hypothetical protein